MALLHRAALRQPFFSDDYFFLEQVRGRSLLAALTAPDPLGNFLRPVSRALHFWVLARAGGEHPLVFHAANLAIFLAVVALMFEVARRAAGPRAAVIASLVLAFHYAADVPLLWASGSQDLLAVLFALGATALVMAGRAWLAAPLLALALLSKETVALAALVALLAARRPGEPWMASLRRSLPLFLVSVAWGIAWLATAKLRPGATSMLSFEPSGLLAAVAHLPQVAFGLEFQPGPRPLAHARLAMLVWPAVAAGLAALAWNELPAAAPAAAGTGTAPARAGERRVRPSAKGRHSRPASKPDPVGGSFWRRLDTPVAWGAAWALCGAVPLALVAPIWSAYFYLFAMCGVALALGAMARAWSVPSAATLVALLVLGSAGARGLQSFGETRGAWVPRSHVNRHYLTRATRRVSFYLAQMLRLEPSLPHRSVVFFGNMPSSLGWQAGDGPLLRWAYRDTSLRSWYVTQFDEARASRGPVYFFTADKDTLRDRTHEAGFALSVAYTLMLGDRPGPALRAMDLASAAQPGWNEAPYWRAWPLWARGDTLAAKQELAAAGMRPVRSTREPRFPGAASDSAALRRWLLASRAEAALDPWVHEQLSEFALSRPGGRASGALEAYALLVLSPEDPEAWRRWVSVQLLEQQYLAALRNLEHYVAIGGPVAANDPEVRSLLARLRRYVSGAGDTSVPR